MEDRDELRGTRTLGRSARPPATLSAYGQVTLPARAVRDLRVSATPPRSFSISFPYCPVANGSTCPTMRRFPGDPPETADIKPRPDREQTDTLYMPLSGNNTEYRKAKYQTEKARKAIRECDPQDYERKKQLIKNLKAVRSVQLKTPCKSQTDKKIQYIRYADDFILSVNGSREECIEIKKKLSQYISEVLKMQLSDEKTLITHSSNHARFLGYDISVRRNAKIKSKNGGVSLRTLNNKVELLIPLKEKINRFMFDKGVIFQKKDGSLFPTHRSYMIHMSDLEIISTYNSELRGICNYYNLASNYCQLRYFAYLMEYSCLKTLAAKHNTKISKIIAKFKDGKGGWGIPYETKSGKKRCYFAKYSDCKDSKDGTDNISNAAVIYGYSRNTLEERLKAKVCELCGDTNAEYYEIHHVHKVKDLKGKNDWERAMIAKRRKTLVLCRNCHHKVHNQ